MLGRANSGVLKAQNVFARSTAATYRYLDCIVGRAGLILPKYHDSPVPDK